MGSGGSSVDIGPLIEQNNALQAQLSQVLVGN